jgi:RNA polymerase-binding transcription factor DksA
MRLCDPHLEYHVTLSHYIGLIHGRVMALDEIDVANERMGRLNRAAIQAVLSSQPLQPSSGICRTCAIQIEPERLQANPFAHTCCDCAAEAEATRQRAKRIGGR